MGQLFELYSMTVSDFWYLIGLSSYKLFNFFGLSQKSPTTVKIWEHNIVTSIISYLFSESSWLTALPSTCYLKLVYSGDKWAGCLLQNTLKTMQRVTLWSNIINMRSFWSKLTTPREKAHQKVYSTRRFAPQTSSLCLSEKSRIYFCLIMN